MKRLLCVIIMGVVAGIVMGASAWTGSENTNPTPAQIRLELDLIDGSHLIGVPKVESVPIQTSYAKLDIALKQILTIALAEDHKTASLDLRNGDKLTGVVTLGPVNLDTLFGNVKVGMEHITGIQVFHGGVWGTRIREGLVLHYSFDTDEAGRVTDKSPTGLNGRASGTRWTPEGKIGGGCEFDGSQDHVRIPNHKALQFETESFSICAWVKTSAHGRRHVMGTNWGPSLWIGLRVTEKNKASFGVLTGGQGPLPESQEEIADGNWHHWVGVRDAAAQEVKLYIDARKAGTAPDTTDKPLSTTVDWAIGTLMGSGNSPYTSDRFFAGQIDEVRIYNRALSQAEVQQVYSLRK